MPPRLPLTPAGMPKLNIAVLRRPAALTQVGLAARQQQQVRMASHGPVYDPPSGWLWAIPPGQKAKTEGWEWIWYTFMFGGCGLAIVGYYYKPDTSIQTWALEEARRRLEAEGVLEGPAPRK